MNAPSPQEYHRHFVPGGRGKRRRIAAAVPLPLSLWLQLKQQIQLSSSSSCSCSLALRKNHENMGRRKHTHKWMKREQRYLVILVNDMAPAFDGWTDDLYDAVANRINEKYGHTHKYVPLDGAMVKCKIKESRKLFGKGDKEDTSQETLYSKFTLQFPSSVSAKDGPQFTNSFSVGAMEDSYSRFFSASEATSTGAPSVSNKRKYTTPKDLDSSLKYLAEHGCTGIELFIFTAALENPVILTTFIAVKSYAKKREHLITLWKVGIVKVPEVEGIDPKLLPPDFR